MGESPKVRGSVLFTSWVGFLNWVLIGLRSPYVLAWVERDGECIGFQIRKFGPLRKR